MNEINRNGSYGLPTVIEQEVVNRMNMLSIRPELIDIYVKDRKIGVTSHRDYGSIDIVPLSEINEKLSDSLAERIRWFEREFGGTVYHVILSGSNDRFVFATFLYVSQWIEEWEEDRKELENDGYTVAYVMNLVDDICSEVGGVKIRPYGGGVVRVE